MSVQTDLCSNLMRLCMEAYHRLPCMTVLLCVCVCNRCQRDVKAAEANLQQILVAMRKLLRLPRLEYVSIQNQADFLIEVPVEMTDVPKVKVLSSRNASMRSSMSRR